MHAANSVGAALVVAVAAGILALAGRAHAKDPAVAGAPVAYKDGEAECEGYVAKSSAVKGKRPAVIVFADWMGIGDFSREKADAFAGMGYVGFAADVYGKGVRPEGPQDAGRLAGKWKGDRKAFRARVAAAFDALLKDPDVDPERVAAIGYCFGGTAALELARTGAKVAAIVSFHGGLSSPTPADGKSVRAKVLALHGADDPFVKPEEVAGFIEEMRGGGVDWQLVQYGGAVHAFTNPAAGDDNSKGAAYNAAADRRSWEAMKSFFAEALGAGGK